MMIVKTLGWIVALGALIIGSPSPAFADQSDSLAVIAVLPMSTGDASMSIYSKPVAKAVIRQLQTSMRDRGGFKIESASGSSSVSPYVDLVVDGRIVARSSGSVLLEAQVRDPERGELIDVIATEAKKLTDIDGLAKQLGAKLAPALASAIEEQRRRVVKPIAMPETVVEDPKEPDATPPDGDRPAARPRAPARPRLVVFHAIGSAAGGAVPIEDVATATGYHIADALGYQPVASRERGIVAPIKVVEVLRQAGAQYGLMLDVKSIDFDWYGVLTARGTFRTILVDAQGRSLYDRVHRTDTLVGSRSDRHAALVRFVMAQASDILMPRLTRLVSSERREVSAPGSGARSPQ